MSSIIDKIKTYLKYKPVYDAFQKAPFKKRYKRENADALKRYSDVKIQLLEKFPDKKLPTLEHLYQERSARIAQRNEKNNRYKEIVADVKELNYARTTIDAYIRNQQKARKKDLKL